MKKRTLHLTLVTLLGIMQARADIKIDKTNFPDQNFRDFLKYEQSYGRDGVITDDEIKSVTYISLFSRAIENLKGIEYFTALTMLYCSGNQLPSLDVSKNTALILLNCGGNQLTSLDVSKNTALTGLDCSWNQLTTLDVSNNTALTGLECVYCQLTSLDVSKNTALILLNCGGNQLTSLDVSKNTALISFYCWDNLLTTLDVSKNTALTVLQCGGNQLTTLDVSKNTVLTGLQCSSNQLTTLDVSNNTALTELYCNQNQLTSLDVSKNTALTELTCYLNQIKGSGMDALVKSLPTSSNSMEMASRRSGENGQIVIISTDPNEGNELTAEQVATAKSKGWAVYCQNGYNQEEYEGPTGIEELKNSKVEGLKYYDLQGRRVVNPTKGMYILNGKKVLAK